MKCIFLLVVIAFVNAQKPNYLAGNNANPELAYRFRTDESTTISPLGDRLGADGGTTRRLPIDARNDPHLVDYLESLPRQNKPFWLLNYEAIEAMRNPQGAQSTQSGNAQVQTNRPTVLQERFNPDSGELVHEERGFDPNYEYDDFGNRAGPRRN